MLTLSFKNRIAFYYSISTAMLIFVVFIIIYSIVSFSVYKNVTDNINYEADEYLEKIQFVNNQPEMLDKSEWIKQEHNEVSVNPVFLVLTDSKGKIIVKSENLKNENLSIQLHNNKIITTDFKLADKLLKQIQVPLIIN